MQLTIKITRPEDNTEPFFYEVEDSLYPGSAAMRQYLVNKELMSCNDSFAVGGSEVIRTLTFKSQLEYFAFKSVMSQRFPEYASGRESYCEANGHTVIITQSESIEERFYDPDEDTLTEIRDVLLTL